MKVDQEFVGIMLPQYMALCVCMYVTFVCYIKNKGRQEAEIWYGDCSHKYKINQGVMVGGKRPSVDDDLWWKTTFSGRQPLAEDDLRWKTTFGGRRSSVEDNLWGRTTIGGR